MNKVEILRMKWIENQAERKRVLENARRILRGKTPLRYKVIKEEPFVIKDMETNTIYQINQGILASA